MAVSRDFCISAALGSCPFKHHRLGSSFQPSKVAFKDCYGGVFSNSWEMSQMTQPSCLNSKEYKSKCHYNQSFGIAEDSELIPEPVSQETEDFLLDAINMSFFERLNLAWKIMFPSPSTRRNSNAKIAKQRLQMILFSDRCAVTDGAKQKIVSNIVGALSDFVEIDSQDKVQLSVSADSEMGTVYSVTVPVRRVKPEHQAVDELGAMKNVEYKDTGTSSDSVDVKFDFYIPNKSP
ncbi:putative Cell division topological specificity factor MinE [Rosa chinensis]|uniref:Putative Cell division topological specificity factor MinE n=1 Tax=Rosa chinensis TaxID=74649 RepID=A0A2P6S474_ROSCH|nr:cell division topological specificity factor homolog, chloroplastic [Rosa chinensis]PRQ53479.1 putative Cell division topological specificity factor MinE [Rosa chinensis]